jgi:uncharacterized membrane protein
MEKLVKAIIKLFGGLASITFGKEIIVFFISILPILELRGGLLAAAILGVKPLTAYIVSMIGNILPVPFILLFINKILEWMLKSKVKWISKMAKWLYKKADKNKEKIEKYGYLGLLLFVGIPLPGTGAWTGCLVASVLEMDKKKSFIAAMIGVAMASIIMMLISFGLLRGITG